MGNPKKSEKLLLLNPSKYLMHSVSHPMNWFNVSGTFINSSSTNFQGDTSPSNCGVINGKIPDADNEFMEVPQNSLPLTETQKKMYEETGIKYQALINALGGSEKVCGFPILMVDENQNISDLKVTDLTHPIMRGKWKERPFIAVCYLDVSTDLHNVGVFLRGEDEGETDYWHCFGGDLVISNGNLGKTTCNKDADKFREEIILSRLNRLVHHQMIGFLKLTPSRKDGFLPECPPNKPSAGMKDDVFYSMGGFYEIKPNSEVEWTALGLWDPSKEKDENMTIIERIS